jgi:predicted 3-demethylubiquinone-9 3-methyltransferase (glyoxalase superfamily)
MQKITPFLWFDDEAHDAAKFYVSLFKDSKITGVTHYGAAGPGKKGTVMSVTFKLAGQEFMALNGGPVFTFTPAMSLFVNCKTQKEVDRLWEKLSKGGHVQQCGWLTDRYGVTWQIVPTVLGELLESKNAEKVQRVMKAMMGMIKLDIAGLEAAAAAKPEKDAKPAKTAKPAKKAKKAAKKRK